MATRAQLKSAKLNALLRYAPQREALDNLTREAQERYGSTVTGAESAGRLTSNAVQQAKPLVSGIYDRAQSTSTSAQQGLASVLAALGPSAGGFQGAAATEAAAGQGKLARERAATEGGLQEQQVAAASAPQFARTLASQQLGTALTKIFASKASLGGQEGSAAYTDLTGKEEADAKERAKAEAEANKAAQSERQSLRQQGTTERGQNLTRQSAQERGGGAKALYKPLSKDKQLAGASEVARAKELAEAAFKEGNHKPSDVAKQLAEGVPSFKTKKGNTTAAIPPIKDRALLEAGVEWAQYGAINRRTLKRLHQVGYSVKSLGVPVVSRQSALGVVGGTNAGR